MDTREQVLAPDEAAAFLKVGKQRVLRLARRGQIPSIKLGPRDIRFYVSDLSRIRRREAKASTLAFAARAPSARTPLSARRSAST